MRREFQIKSTRWCGKGCFSSNGCSVLITCWVSFQPISFATILVTGKSGTVSTFCGAFSASRTLDSSLLKNFLGVILRNVHVDYRVGF